MILRWMTIWYVSLPCYDLNFSIVILQYYDDQNHPPEPDAPEHRPPPVPDELNMPQELDMHQHHPPEPDALEYRPPPVPDEPDIPHHLPPEPDLHEHHPPQENAHLPQYELEFERRERPHIDVEALARSAVLPKVKETMEFVLALKQASLEDQSAKMSDEALQRLRNPPRGPIDVNSPAIRHSISTYLALEHASQDAYNRIRRSLMQNFSGIDGVDDILSFHAVEKLVAAHTGVEPIIHDMCSQSCMAYTGPYATLEHCTVCGTSRWDQAKLAASNGRRKVAAQNFSTIPLAPQLQALYRNPDSACDMRYLHERTQEVLTELRATGTIPVIDDIVMGWDYLTAVIDGDIKEGDIALMVSLDGAQLYESKESDCWIYMWVVLNLSPNKRYRKVHVRPGGFIPGPNKPKNVDSFLFVGMHHLAAIQNEGLTVWDASRDATFISDIHLIFTTADGPGLVYWDGMVGHSGKNGCRIYCGVQGRRKTRGTRYYPALLKPTDHSVIGSNHPDIDVFKIPLGGSDDYETNLKRLITSPNQRQFDLRKTETGITKPPLILGLSPSRSLGVPFCMTTDIMHLAANLSDLLLSLWRGTLDCGPSDNVETWDWAVFRDEGTWTIHGAAVENAGPYLPTSFDRKPRNISEKLNTGYKTWEFQLYMFGLAPALLYDILPRKYWSNYCQLVRGFQLMCQYRITAQELVHAQALLCCWERDFELLYYRRREDRIHFIRPCVHQTNHLVSETVRKGPSICYAQWTMERTIGNLGQEIRQPSNPFANLSQEGVRRCRINTLLSIMPELDNSHQGLPNGSVDLGDGYVLLRKRERYAKLPDGADAQAIANFLGARRMLPRIKKWARLLLPNKQVARSAWRETTKAREQVRMSRNVKVCLFY